MICNNLTVNGQGHLCLGGQDTTELAKQYGTPLYLMDENRIRERCRTYLNAMKEAFGDASLPLYASKAASFKQIYRIMKEEGMGVDVVSSGEIYTAVSVGFPMERAYFHSNNKTDADIDYAMENGIGYFVVDNREELDAIEYFASKRGITQKILLRLTPGIDTHTYAAVNTGKVDSKFGSAIETGQADEITAYTLSLSHIKLSGYHCHIGSQVFDSDTFLRAAAIMLNFANQMREKYGLIIDELDLGGGYGVRYLEEHPEIQIVLDIHRDAITQDNGEKIKPVNTISGKKAAQLMIITGVEEGKVKDFPDWEYNLRFALHLQKKCESMFPGLMRPVLFSQRKYNMDMTRFSLLVEMGSEANTLEEACYSGRMLAAALASLMEEYTA